MKSLFHIVPLLLLTTACNLETGPGTDEINRQNDAAAVTTSPADTVQRTSDASGVKTATAMQDLADMLRPGMAPDSTHAYGGGDCFGNFTYYSLKAGILGVDTLSCGDYGYEHTLYLLNAQRELQVVYLQKAEIVPQPEPEWPYALTETTVDFRMTPAIMLERTDTLLGNPIKEIGKAFIVKKLKGSHGTRDYWIKRMKERWDAELLKD